MPYHAIPYTLCHTIPCNAIQNCPLPCWISLNMEPSLPQSTQGTELAGNMYWPKYLNTKTFLFGHIPNWSQHIYVGYWPRDKSTLHLIWIVMIYLWSDVFLAFHWHYHGDIVHVLILRWYWYQYIYCNTHVHVYISGIVLVSCYVVLHRRYLWHAIVMVTRVNRCAR